MREGGGERGGGRGGNRKMEARRNKGMEEIWKALIGERILCVRMNETSKGVLRTHFHALVGSIVRNRAVVKNFSKE